MKKLLCGIFAIILIFSIFVACDEAENPTNPTTTTTQNSTTTTTTTTQPTTAENLVKKAELKNYIGYWYLEDVTQKTDELTISYIELYVKNVEDDLVTLDYSFGTWCGEDIKVLLTEGKNSCHGNADMVMPFKDYLGEGDAIGVMKLKFIKDNDTGNYMINVIFDEAAKGTLNFVYKSPVQIAVPQLSFGENYDFTDYIGDWYDDPGEPDDDWPIQNELHIKQVNGNMVTFDYEVAMTCGEDDITVEVINNIGRFRTDESYGVIIFKEDSIELRTMYMYYGYAVDVLVMNYKHVS